MRTREVDQAVQGAAGTGSQSAVTAEYSDASTDFGT